MKKLNLGIAQPKYQLLQDRISHTVHLSMAKLIAHVGNPSAFPLPTDKKSLEVLFHDHYSSLPKSGQQKFIERIKAFSNVPTGTTQMQSKYGDLSKIDFKSHTSVAKQIQDLPFPEHLKFTSEEKDVITKTILKKRVGTKNQPDLKQPAVVAPRLIRLSVDSVHCTDTVELKKDEILLSGLFTDALGATTEFGLIDIGKMKDGETISLGAKGQLAEVNLNNAGFFPQTLTGTFALIDKDIFADQEKILAAFRTCAIMATTLTSIGLITMGIALGVAATGGGAAAAAGMMTGALVALVGSLVVLVVGGGITLFLQGESSELTDDTFTFDLNPVTLQPGESVVRTLNIDISRSIGKGSGKYSMQVRWERIS